MELTDMQKDAVKTVKDWYHRDMDQIVTVAGYAGTGKSTIVKETIRELELLPHEVKFCTFTGKAALVLTQKGNRASTIHRLIYEPFEVEDPDTGKKKLKFGKRPFLDPEIKAIVVDEVSMVNSKLLEDLKWYGKKIITLGDPGQLPPIGDDNGLLKKPDVFLTEIHRQAADNPIIHLSMLARTGKKIDYGAYGKDAWVIRKSEITPQMLLKADQVICGKNATRQTLNANMRHYLGRTSPVPVKGDKMICLKNNWNQILAEGGYPLINGMIGYVHHDIADEAVDLDRRKFQFDFRPDFVTNDYYEGLYADLTYFYDFQDEYKAKDFEEINSPGVEEFDFGNAITTHKSQGSEWPKVFLYDEMLRRDEINRQRYTGVTRASKKLLWAV